MKILHVVGARPNFMKVAPVIAALQALPLVEQILVHTGQHYDANMSEIFFKQLGIPEPDINLEVGSGSHAQQTAQIMSLFEPVVLSQRPDWVCVYGDVNSTVATSLVCAKLLIPVAHIEAGLRSFDRTMPEEINRLLTDQIADLLFTPSQDGDENLIREGVAPEKIHQVGNVMIDTLIRLLLQAEQSTVLSELGVSSQDYVLATLHRPSNVDTPSTLAEIMETLGQLATQLPIVFPVHPRTRQRLLDLGLKTEGIHLTEPLGYLDFLWLQKNARLVITDSGGVQEETTYLQVPCLTVRENTERPITVTIGTNQLVGQNMPTLLKTARQIVTAGYPRRAIPPLWDGFASQRIAAILTD